VGVAGPVCTGTLTYINIDAPGRDLETKGAHKNVILLGLLPTHSQHHLRKYAELDVSRRDGKMERDLHRWL
jgi:hypothetical protein